MKVDATGCPIDSDGDGIPDFQDKCPNVKGLAAFQGCPDTDGDGIQDSEDRCPNEKGDKALKGCPDRDKDGVADIDDRCPDVPGIKENKGCPEVKTEVKEVFKKALQGIQFATGKDVILKPSYPILDQVAKIMKDNPSYKLIINGHTDNVGKADKNRELSEKRAASVKKYLLDKGVDDSRMKAAGFGDTMPVADNKTKEGQKQNRRVEFVVEF
ncbi:MAG: OmpA family protein [Bacteroidetes bacterium]|nr:OmpA family protein [Bacteroidota bacterium]